MTKAKILIVEDETSLLEAIRYNLVKEGYQTIAAADGLVGLELARSQSPDIVLLDIMLPGMDGLELCRILRKDMTVPILMLTARAEEVDKLVGLEMGADDYMTKPFSMRELLARVKAMLRRKEMTQPHSAKAEGILEAYGLVIDPSRHEVTLKGKALSLKPKEFDLMAFLVKNRGQVFSRDQLLEKVWGYDYAGDTRTVDVHIRWLREQVEADPARPRYLLTVRGVGYKFEG